ncbi:hypothetical protein QZM35_17465 [Burkholderia sp. AU45274]|uniref:hypothetical protein n=1 Tax=Burkholderia sp. AU45274 TaxID=3059205 RepID=UPI002651A520|nr:hypothetical protein [Burkholderia sp. AU45274]MDN7489499.1 hypothetical protein [Burkholderia sp. AU45274]
MDELNAAPSSTEPSDNPNWTPEQLAEIKASDVVPMQINQIAEAGTAAPGEPVAAAADSSPPAAHADADASVPAASSSLPIGDASNTDALAVGGGVDAPSHLLLLDAMLAEIERKIAAGIHTFAHEVTAARNHLAKLL